MKTPVNVGDCYRDSGLSWIDWRVERVYRDAIGLPHAVLSSIQDPTVSRTIACLTLADRRRYWRTGGALAGRAVGAPRLVPQIPEAQPIGSAVEAAA